MEEFNPQVLENLEVLGEIQEDTFYQDHFEDQPHVHLECDKHEECDEREEHEECKKYGMSIDSYQKFASQLEQQVLSPTSWEERLYTPTPQYLGEAEATCE